LKTNYFRNIIAGNILIADKYGESVNFELSGRYVYENGDQDYVCHANHYEMTNNDEKSPSYKNSINRSKGCASTSATNLFWVLMKLKIFYRIMLVKGQFIKT